VIYSPRGRSGVDDDELNTAEFSTNKKMSDAEVEGVRYKVVWSCLLLVEMVMTDMKGGREATIIQLPLNATRTGCWRNSLGGPIEIHQR
jgi:hypothetical protein